MSPASAKEPEVYYTIRELMEMLSCGYYAIMGPIERGELKAKKVGNYWMIRQRDFDAWWERQGEE